MRSAALLFLLCTWLAATESHTPALRQHRVPQAGITFMAPVAWAIEQQSFGPALVLRSPASPPSNNPLIQSSNERARAAVSIVVTPVEASVTADIFSQNCRADLKRMGSNFAVDEVSTYTSHGIVWQLLRYRIDMGSYTFTHILHTSIIRNNGVCITCGCGQESFERYRNEFKNLGLSVTALAP